MANESRSWQREVGKVALKAGERAFVTPEGRVLATDTTNKEYLVYAKERYTLKNKKRQDRVNARLDKQAKRIAKKAANGEKREQEKSRRAKERLLKKQAKLQLKKQEDEKKLMQIEAQLTTA